MSATTERRLREYVAAVAHLKKAELAACAALHKIVRAGDRVQWQKGRGRQSGTVLGVNASYDHSLASITVRSRTGKEYTIGAYWITRQLTGGDVDE